MTVDALVNLFVQHDKPTKSPLANLQNEPESQRQETFTASSPHPIPNASVPLHHSTTTGLPAAVDDIKHASRILEIESRDAKGPGADRCVDLDVFSPPPASPLAAVDVDCAFCGTAGTPATCGALVAVRLGEQNVAVHHACALWAPQVYQAQGCDEYLNLESEWRHSQNRRCLVCNSYGAAVTCTHAGCRAAYHLPCAAVARNVSLDKSSFELWCPKHASTYHDNHNNSEEEDYEQQQYQNIGRGTARQYNRGNAVAERDDEEFSPGHLTSRPRRNAALSRKHRFNRAVDGASNSGGGASNARERAAVVAATAAAAVAVSDRTQRPRTDWQRQGDAWVKVVPPWWCEHRTIHFANKVFRELFCGHTSAFLVDADGTEWVCLVSCETRNDMRLQYTLRGQFQEYWDTAGVKSGDVLTFQRNAPSVGKIKVGRYPQGRGMEAALDISGAGGAGGSFSNNTASKESNIAAAKAVTGTRNTGTAAIGSSGGGSLRIREQQQLKQQRSGVAVAADAEAAGGSASGISHPNRWTELSDGSAAKTVYKSTYVHQQCPIAGWLYKKLYGRSPGDTDTALMRDPALGTNFIFEVAFVPAANVHYISGRAFGTWMKAAGVLSGDQIRVWRDSTGVKICRMASINNNASSIINRFPVGGGGGFGSVSEEDVSVPINEEAIAAVVVPTQSEHQNTFTSPPGVEALAALNALAAAAGYAGQHGTPAIDAVLSHAADLRNLVTTTTSIDGGHSQEVDTLFPIGDALKSRLAAAGMPLPPSPFLTGACAVAGISSSCASEKKRKIEENLGFGSVPKQPRHNNSTNINKSLFPVLTSSAQNIALLPLPPPPAAVSAQPGQQQPGQIQLHQALQQLIRHYQTQMQQQQQHGVTTVPHTQQSITTASKPPPPPPHPPVLFHRATPAAAGAAASDLPPPSSTEIPKQQQQATKTALLPPPTTVPASPPPFAAVTAALGLHQWTPCEAALLVQFRATCAVLDSVGRDIAFTNVLQLQSNRHALLAMIRGVVEADHPKNNVSKKAVAPLNNSEGVSTAVETADEVGVRTTAEAQRKEEEEEEEDEDVCIN